MDAVDTESRRGSAVESDPTWGVPRASWMASTKARIVEYFLGEDPSFWAAMVPAMMLAALLFTRSLTTNFIFDEQEALLANPYVNGKNLRFWDVIHRDFWGLPPERSVGSYRPLPNVLWRAVATAMRWLHDGAQRVGIGRGSYALYPWVFHWCNVVLHAANGALLVCLVFHVSRRRGLAWMSGAIFTAAAVLTEAVSGVVGAADVLGGLGALLALLALRWPLAGMFAGVFAAMLFGLFSKESALVGVPLVPLAAIWLAPYTHPARPRALLRGAFALIASAGAFVLYVECRKRWFPSPTPAELLAPLSDHSGKPARWARAFLLWFHQPALPRDALNNPLVTTDWPHRIAGALRVYFRGLTQIVWPHTLSGDYSFPQEPVPQKLVTLETVLGAAAMVVPPFAAVGVWLRGLWLRRRASRDGERNMVGATHALVALSLVWIVVSYFPHSNIPVLLPTVRAERFWYFPAIGSSVLLAAYFAAFGGTSRATQRFGVALFAVFFVFQCIKARLHAFDYTDDLTFWRATKDAVPRSAKAHLNYSVMWGARGHLDTRLAESRIAADLAPKWAMAHIYLGDTLCRLHRAEEAWPHYLEGFKLAPSDPNLIALGMQCLWDENAFKPHEEELLDLGEEHADSWLDFLARDVAANGGENAGVNPKYRPRGYNEGPKE